mgnify:CR=1 FL=1
MLEQPGGERVTTAALAARLPLVICYSSSMASRSAGARVRGRGVRIFSFKIIAEGIDKE